jgi:hypothetical protein
MAETTSEGGSAGVQAKTPVESRGLDGWLLIAALWPIALLAVLFMASPLLKVSTEYTPDDAYFYLVVARNAARGISSSFSGLDPTNGYHPLWAWLLRPLFLIVSDRGLAIRIICLGQMAMYAGCVVLLLKSMPRALRAEGALVGILFSFLAAYASWYGLEAGLACLLFLISLSVARRYVSEASDLKRALVLGVCSGLTVLSRLDAALLLAPALLYVAWVDHQRKLPLWRAFLPAVVGAACVVPYIASNWLTYGHPMPISGFIKSSFPTPSPVNYPLVSRRWARLAVPLLLALAAQVVALRRMGELRSERRRIVLLNSAVAAGLLVFYSYELLFQHDADWALFSWHFSVATAAACALVADALSLLQRPLLSKLAYAMVALGVLALASFRFRPTLPGDSGLLDVMNAAQWVERNVKAGTPIATTDSGIIAYFGDRPTVNLDGLINNFEYQDVVRAGRLPEYLTERKVSRVIITGRGFYRWSTGCFCSPVESRNRKNPDTWLCFEESDLLYRTPGHPRKPQNGRTGVFNWPPAHLQPGSARSRPSNPRACAVRDW